MGRTIPSTTARIDETIQRWRGFERALMHEQKQAFQKLITAARNMRGAIGEADEPDITLAIFLAMLIQLKADITNDKQHEKQQTLL